MISKLVLFTAKLPIKGRGVKRNIITYVYVLDILIPETLYPVHPPAPPFLLGTFLICFWSKPRRDIKKEDDSGDWFQLWGVIMDTWERQQDKPIRTNTGGQRTERVSRGRGFWKLDLFLWIHRNNKANNTRE